MENQIQPQEEEIQNIEQFQINRGNGNAAEGHQLPEPESEDSEYTAEEVPFADGEGSQLHTEIGPGDEEEDEEDDLSVNTDEDPDDDSDIPDPEEFGSGDSDLDDDEDTYEKDNSEVL